jgi:hypothetical protein
MIATRTSAIPAATAMLKGLTSLYAYEAAGLCPTTPCY